MTKIVRTRQQKEDRGERKIIDLDFPQQVPYSWSLSTVTREGRMKFVISTQEFNYLISRCLNVVSSKMTIPILSNVHIKAVNDELIVTATDLTLSIRCFTEVKILEEGATTLPAKRLAQLLRELHATNLEVTTQPNEITEIVAGSSRFKLNGMNQSEFPALPALTDARQFKIPQKELKGMLSNTAFAVSREDTRYVLTGVFLQIAQQVATFVGTDGRRLARAHLNVELDPAFSANYIIPLKAVEEIQKNLKEEGDATIYLMPDKIGVEASNALIITKLLSGDYPDFNRIIPDKSELIVALHREELMTLLRQISLFAGDAQNHSVRFTFEDGELFLSASSMEVGEGRASMPANYRGPKFEIAFNPHYFLDILRQSSGTTVTVGVTHRSDPGIIIDKEIMPLVASSPLFVLMPMRLNGE